MAAFRKFAILAAAGAVALVAGCNAPAPTAEEHAQPPATQTGTPAKADAKASPLTDTGETRVAEAREGGAVEELDFAALKDRTDPERLLRFYAAALQEGRWDAAETAWSEDADVSAADLAKAYGTGALPKVALGRGDTEGAAGHLFYEAPIALEFADGREGRSGIITLSRVNDVPGASERQRNWRIERSTLLRPQ